MTAIREIVAQRRREALLIISLVLCSAALPGDDAASDRDIEIDLEEAISRAVEYSPELRLARQEQQIAATRYDLGLRTFLPRLSVSYSQNGAVSYFNPDSRVRRIALGLEQLIYDGGVRRQRREVERLSLLVARTDYHRAVDDVILQVVLAYAELICREEEEAILRQTYDAGLQQLSIAGEERAIGAVTDIDLLDLEIRVKELEIEAEGAAHRMRHQAQRLGRLIGLPPGTRPAVVESINPGYKGFLDAEAADSLLRRTRLESTAFQERQIALESRREELRRVRRRWIPSVSTDLEASVAGDSFPLTEPGFAVGLSLSFGTALLPAESRVAVGRQGPYRRTADLSASGRPADNLEELTSPRLALLEVNRSRQRLLDFEEDISFSIEEGVARIESACRTLALRRERQQLETRRERVDSLRLRLGEITRLAFVKGSIERAQTQIELNTAIVELFRSEVALLRSLELTDGSRGYRKLISGASER